MVSDISVEYGFGTSFYVDNSVARPLTGAPDPAAGTTRSRCSCELCPINNEGEIIIERYRAVGSNRKVSSQLKADSVSTGIIRTLEVDHSVVCNTAAAASCCPLTAGTMVSSLLLFSGVMVTAPLDFMNVKSAFVLLCAVMALLPFSFTVIGVSEVDSINGAVIVSFKLFNVITMASSLYSTEYESVGESVESAEYLVPNTFTLISSSHADTAMDIKTASVSAQSTETMYRTVCFMIVTEASFRRSLPFL